MVYTRLLERTIIRSVQLLEMEKVLRRHLIKVCGDRHPRTITHCGRSEGVTTAEWINQFSYIAIWAGFYTVLETIFAYKGLYVYDNGWNGWLNIPLNIILFVMIYIHYRSPVKALIISIPIAILFYLFFPVPLDSLK